MNVVANGKTSRVVFTVTDGKMAVKLPDFGKIVKFLRGKAGNASNPGWSTKPRKPFWTGW